MDEPQVRLPRPQADLMIAHAKSGVPEEVCGLVAQTLAGEIVAMIAVENAAKDKVITYSMEPMSQHRAFMTLEQQGWELAGIYHSHPASPAYPSETDQALAFDPYDDEALFPGAYYFIVSLADRMKPVIRAFLLPDPESIVEVDVLIDA